MRCQCRSLLGKSLVAVLLAQVMVMATTMSVTCDESGHFGAGLSVWDYGKFDVYRVNPPLVRLLACAPVALLNPNRDYGQYAEGPSTRVEWKLGQSLIAANPDDWEWYFLFARWAVVPLTLIGAWFVQRWASELYGGMSEEPSPPATVPGPAQTGWFSTTGCGLFALAIYSFCPNIVAWSGTITPDAAAAVLGVAAGYSFWKWLREPTWRRAIEAGVWMGLAELTKFSWIILFPLWPLLWGLWRLTEGRTEHRAPTTEVQMPANMTVDRPTPPSVGKTSASDESAAEMVVAHRLASPPLGQLAGILLLALYAINLGYAFEGSFTPIKHFVFVSRSLAGKDSKPDNGRGGNRFKDSWIGQIPVPVPYNYLRGIDLQKVDFEEGKPSYLNGEWSPRGWWYYYLYAATLKIPLGTWILGAFVLVMKLWLPTSKGERRESDRPECEAFALSRQGQAVTWRDEVVLLAPAVVLFVLVSSQTGFSRYFRYVLPCFPFVYVWLGQAGRWLVASGGLSQLRWPAWIVGGALAWSVVSSLSVFPYSMSYFNELAGGPRNGHFYLVDANIDWGQDVYHLRNWLRQHPEATPLHAAPLCFVQPRHYGITSETPAEVPMPGWYAMSIHRIHGERGVYTFFLRYKPVAMAGYSIYIYHVTLDDANRVRRELGLPELAPDASPPRKQVARRAGPEPHAVSVSCCDRRL